MEDNKWLLETFYHATIAIISMIPLKVTAVYLLVPFVVALEGCWMV